MIDQKLKSFVALVEEESYTKAAIRLHLTQPAITQHVQQLENYYGMPLIHGSHKGIQLTQAGHHLYEYAKLQLHNEVLFEARIKRSKRAMIIGSTLSIADYYLPYIVTPYLMNSTQNCELVVGNTAMLIQQMMDGVVDCAFVEGKFDAELFDFHLFKEENYLPIVRKGHPLAQQECSFQDLLTYPLFLREIGSGTRSIIEAYVEQSVYALTSFKRVITSSSLTMIKEMLPYSNGITFMYEGVVKKELEKGELVRLKLKDFPLRHAMYFIYLKSNLEKDHFANMFLAMMKGHRNGTNNL